MWQKKAGHEHDHIDGRTGTHHIRLHNPVTDGEHLLHIVLGVDSCPHCKRPFPKDDLGEVDPKAIVADALEMLRKNHDAVMAYAAKHGMPIKVGVNAVLSRDHQLISRGDDHKMLMATRPVK